MTALSHLLVRHEALPATVALPSAEERPDRVCRGQAATHARSFTKTIAPF
jgi:hypothetical protein